MVNVTHGLSASAETTTKPRPAIVKRMMIVTIEAVKTAHAADFLFRDRGQRFDWLDRAARMTKSWTPGRDRTQKDPEKTGQIPELRRQNRPDQWPRARDRRKVLPKDNPFAHRNIVLAVVQTPGRGLSAIVQSQGLGHNEPVIETGRPGRRPRPLPLSEAMHSWMNRHFHAEVFTKTKLCHSPR